VKKAGGGEGKNGEDDEKITQKHQKNTRSKHGAKDKEQCIVNTHDSKRIKKKFLRIKNRKKR
jgi:hypothetical protein